MKKFITLTVLALALSTGLASAQTSAEDYCQAGLAHMNKGEYKQAQARFAQALQMEPNNQDIAVALSIASNRAGDYDTAIKAGVYVLENLNKSNSYAFREIGFAFAVKAAIARKNGDASQAKECWDAATELLVKSLELKKNDKAAWDYLIAHFEASGETELARKTREARAKVMGS